VWWAARQPTASDRGPTRFGQAEIKELRPELREHHVARLQIAVHDTVSMRRAECGGNLDGHDEGIVERQRALLQPVGQRLALETLHDEKRHALLVTDVVECADVGMGELRDRARFTIEAFAELRIVGERLGKNLDGDCPIEAGVAGLVHLAHATGPKPGKDLVRAEAGACGNGHGCGRRV
jgi:hypothetical protein